MKHTILNRLGSFPILPLLIAAIPSLHLMRTNPAMFSGGADLIRIFAVCIVAALLITVLLGLFLRNFHRAGILATIAVGLLIFGGSPGIAGAQILEAKLGLAIPPSVLLLAIFGVAALLLSRVRIPPVVTQAGNAVTAALLAYNISSILLAAPEAPSGVERQAIPEMKPAVQHFSSARVPQDPPDIIHIVLDGYSRADVLTEIYGFDNSAFLSDLERLGFAVAGEAVTPYNQTLLTMSGIFRGDYLESAGDSPVASAAAYRNALATAFQANPVINTLREMGYRIASTKPEYPLVTLRGTVMSAPTQGPSMTHLERTLFNFSGVSLIVGDLGLSTAIGGNSALEIRSALGASRKERGARPYFHYLHLMAPHPPFDVDSGGRAISKAGTFNQLADGSHLHANDPKKKSAYRDGYLQKLAFINSEITAFVRTAISERQGRLLILIHGDHGGGMHFDQNDVSATCTRERYLPLLAVYSSDGDLQRSLPPDINLVNIYRIVFNRYFGTELAELPGKSSFASYDVPAIHTPLPPHALERACPGSR